MLSSSQRTDGGWKVGTCVGCEKLESRLQKMEEEVTYLKLLLQDPMKEGIKNLRRELVPIRAKLFEELKMSEDEWKEIARFDHRTPLQTLYAEHLKTQDNIHSGELYKAFYDQYESRRDQFEELINSVCDLSHRCKKPFDNIFDVLDLCDDVKYDAQKEAKLAKKFANLVIEPKPKEEDPA